MALNGANWRFSEGPRRRSPIVLMLGETSEASTSSAELTLQETATEPAYTTAVSAASPP
jgi:hypothetical protein